jgi:hypothetical protein
MSDEDREDRMKNRLSDRFNTGEDNDSNDDRDAVDVVESDDASDTNNVVEDNNANESVDNVAPQQRSVRDTTGRTFYVGEETLEDLDALYKELEFRYYQEYGDDLPKNKQFYPALFDVVVENPDLVAEKLGLEDSSNK